MKRNFLNILILLALVSTISSCHNNDEAKPSKTSLLTAKSWVISKFEFGGNDLTSEMDDCDTDDSILFKANGTLIQDVGTIKCDDTEVNSGGTWKFKTNETIITIHPDGEDMLDWKILELTSSTFKLSHFDNDVDQDLVITF